MAESTPKQENSVSIKRILLFILSILLWFLFILEVALFTEVYTLKDWCVAIFAVIISRIMLEPDEGFLKQKEKTTK